VTSVCHQSRQHPCLFSSYYVRTFLNSIEKAEAWRQVEEMFQHPTEGPGFASSQSDVRPLTLHYCDFWEDKFRMADQQFSFVRIVFIILP
jgi:hypothetical protein